MYAPTPFNTFRSKDTLRTCPYNPSHQIFPERMQYHLVKCMKANPHIKLIMCPYNATHHIKESQKASHMMACPDRWVEEVRKSGMNDLIPGQHGDLSMPKVFGTDSIPKALVSAPSRSKSSKVKGTRKCMESMSCRRKEFQENDVIEDWVEDCAKQTCVENYKSHSRSQDITTDDSFFIHRPMRTSSPIRSLKSKVVESTACKKNETFQESEVSMDLSMQSTVKNFKNGSMMKSQEITMDETVLEYPPIRSIPKLNQYETSSSGIGSSPSSVTSNMVIRRARLALNIDEDEEDDVVMRINGTSLSFFSRRG